MTRRSDLGAAAESAAAKALEDAGYLILARNVRNRGGEIDIVATRRGKVAIVEVKARKIAGYAGSPEEALTPQKLRRVARAADLLLQSRGIPDAPREFLGVAVDLNESGQAVRVRIVPVEEVP